MNVLNILYHRSIGVIVYVLLSGVSPFLDESTEETCSNIVRCDYSFPDDYFAGVSQDARDFISSLLSSEPRWDNMDKPTNILEKLWKRN